MGEREREGGQIRDWELTCLSFIPSRTCLMQTLVTVIQSLEFAKAKGVKVRFHDRQKNEPAHYCGQCEVRIEGGLNCNSRP